MIVFPNAKINLGLNIIRKRADGYHDIESCFYPVGWSDVLEIVENDSFRFQSDGIHIPESKHGNLCIQAYQLLKKDFNLPEIDIFLLKNIPIGAGLGGGSADSSFTLRILNKNFNLNISEDRLREYAGKLGSDCPFFVSNLPVIASGTGTTFSPVNINLKGLYIHIIYPELHISTAEAYSGIIPQAASISIKGIIENHPITDWKETLVNDFESPLFLKYSILPEIKQTLYDNGAVYASMTGSGSAIYGIFESPAGNLFPEFPSFRGELMY